LALHEDTQKVQGKSNGVTPTQNPTPMCSVKNNIAFVSCRLVVHPVVITCKFPWNQWPWEYSILTRGCCPWRNRKSLGDTPGHWTKSKEWSPRPSHM